MRFITRELYLSQQPDSDIPEEESEQDWDDQWKALRQHFEEIKSKLPEGAQALGETTFHDSLVENISQPISSEVVVSLDASRNPWGPQGKIELVFHGVVRVSGLNDIVGDYWLYEEVDLDQEGSFRFNVLFEKSELEICANDVEIKYAA